MICEESSKKALKVCSNKNWIGVGAYVKYKKITSVMMTLFCVTMEELVRK